MSLYGLEHLITQAVQAGIDSRLAQRAAAYNAETGSFVTTLRLPKLFAVLGWIYVVIGAIFLYGVYDSYPAVAPCLGIGAGALIFLTIGVLFVRYHQRHQVLFNDETFYVTGLWGAMKHYKWTEITTGRFKQQSRVLELRTSTGRKITMSYHLVGFKAFMAMLDERTDLPVRLWVSPPGL